MGDTTMKLAAIVRREYLERVRTKWFIIGTVFGPLLFAAFGFIPIWLARRAEAPSARVLVLDATGTSLGRYVAQAMGAAGANDSTLPQPDLRPVAPGLLGRAERDAEEEVQHRLANGYVALDSATLSGGSVRYAGRRADSRGEISRIAEAVRTARVALAVGARGLPAAVVDSIIALPVPVVHAEAITDQGARVGNTAKQLLAIFVAFFLYIAIVFHGQSMLSGVIEEKTSRVAEIVVSSVSPETLLAGKVLGVTAVGITQMVVWIGGTVALLAARATLFGASAAPHAPGAAAGEGSDFLAAVLATPWSWVAVVAAFFLLGFIFYGALYAAVGATVGSESEARQAAQPVILLLVLTAVFISPVASDPGSTLARVLTLLPFSSPILMPLRMAIADISPWEVAASLGLLLLGSAGAVWLAARIYRVGLLMYGKRPTLRELRRWIAAS